MRAAGVDVRLQTANSATSASESSVPYPCATRIRPSQVVEGQRPDLAILVDGEHFNLFLTSISIARALFITILCRVWFWDAGGPRHRPQALPRHPRLQAESGNLPQGAVSWLGHPLLDIAQPGPDPGRRSSNGLDPARPTVARFPAVAGRKSRISAHAGAAAQLLRQTGITPSCPSPRRTCTRPSSGNRAGWSLGIRLVSESVSRASAFAKSRCFPPAPPRWNRPARRAHGRLYRVTPLTCFIRRRLVTSRFIAMPNILLNEAVVPELISQFTVERLLPSIRVFV
jgi:hypothetical protein